MDQFTKHKVRRAIKANPDLSVKVIIQAIRSQQQPHTLTMYVRSTAKQGEM